MKNENYFETLAEALDEAARRATEDGAERDCEELLRQFAGGVSYGQTVRGTVCLSKYRGKVFKSGGGLRGLTVVIYRVENGKYELTSYIS